MKALVMRAPGEYGVEDVKKPVPGFQEVLVRMHSVAICGSDPPLLAGREPEGRTARLHAFYTGP